MHAPLTSAALLLISAAGLLAGCAAAPPDTRTAAAPALVDPEVFAPGVLSAGNAWKGSFAPDGRSFYFFQKQPEGKEDYRIYVSRLQDTGVDVWSAPERVDLGGDFSDLYPVVSPDGRRLVFASYRPAPGDGSGKPHANLWLAMREGDRWGSPVFLSQVNEVGKYHSQPAIDGKGDLYFRRDNVTFVSRWTGETYGPPEPFAPINRWTSGWRDDRFVWGGVPSPDGSFIMLEVSTREADGKRSPADLWITRRQGDGWTEPVPLGHGVNTPLNENFIFFSPDGRDLYFVRDFKQFLRIPVAALER